MEMSEEKFFQLRKAGKTYISKVFSWGAHTTEKLRNVRMVMEGSDEIHIGEVAGAMCLRLSGEKRKVILPFLTGRGRRTYAAIFSFIAGVMPPMPIFGRSLLYVHNHCVAKCWASSMLLMMYWSSHSCLTVRL